MTNERMMPRFKASQTEAARVLRDQAPQRPADPTPPPKREPLGNTIAVRGVSDGLKDWLEAERARRGLRSVNATVLAILGEASEEDGR